MQNPLEHLFRPSGRKAGTVPVSTPARTPGTATSTGTDAFTLLTEDQTDKAREIIQHMSRRDRALVLFTAEEMVRLLREEESYDQRTDWHRAREARYED